MTTSTTDYLIGLFFRIVFGAIFGFSLAGFATDIIEGEGLIASGINLGICTALMLSAIIREAVHN